MLLKPFHYGVSVPGRQKHDILPDDDHMHSIDSEDLHTAHGLYNDASLPNVSICAGHTNVAAQDLAKSPLGLPLNGQLHACLLHNNRILLCLST